MAYRSFFSTEFGRQVMAYGAAILSGGLFLGNYVPHTFLLNKYKEVVQFYRHGEGKPVKENVMVNAREVIADMKLTEHQQQHLQFFTVVGVNVFHAGSFMLSNGGLIGLPETFGSSLPEINKKKGEMLVANEHVDLDLPAGEALLNALVLSKNAQKFVIARQLSHIKKAYVYWNAILPAAVYMSVHALGRWLNDRLQLFKKPYGLRFVMYAVLGLQGLALWAVSKDSITCYYEGVADSEACALGKDYTEGAVEFYQKVLKRNIALKQLMGAYGEKCYTAYGNEHLIFRTKHIPYTLRLQYVTELLKSLQETPEQDSENLTEMGEETLGELKKL